MSFLEVFLGGSDVVRCHGGIFFYVMVGGVGGVSGPKELMGWDDAVCQYEHGTRVCPYVHMVECWGNPEHM